MTAIETSARLAIDGGTPIRTRPFAPNCHIGGRERELLLDALESCNWSGFRAGAGANVRDLCATPSSIARDLHDVRYLGGRYVRLLESMFAARTRTTFAIACNSATSGLVMAFGAIGLEPGDEVLVPSMSFHATATAILAFQAVPVFVEVDPHSFCIDPHDAALKITPRTRAIIAVHLGGVPADMRTIVELARQHDLKVIEDCAQSLGARIDGVEVGAIGDAGVYSLTETKSITCGEGGVVVTNDPRIAIKSRLIRNHGEGAADESWRDDELANVVGMNFRLTELQAAVAVAQFEQLDERNEVRNENANALIEGMRPFPQFIPQQLAANAERACYMPKFRYVAGASMPSRDELVRILAAEGIPVVAGYPRLLHENPIFTRRIAYGTGGAPFNDSAVRYGAGTCPRSEALNRELLWFPFVNPPNTIDDMRDAVRAIEKVFS
jgi:dTDP-4-amino-4,6-dideoxygalactose transaminase